MAILKDGINGSFSGKVGSIVGYQLNGQNVIRSVPKMVKRKPSALVLANRARMKAVSQFLASLKPVINFGYRSLAPKGSRVGTFQSAQSYVFKHAVEFDEEGQPYVVPEKVLVFRGTLTPPNELEVKREGSILQITWDQERAIPHAVLLLVAYDPQTNALWFEEGGTKASIGQYSWHLRGAGIQNNPHIHVYAGFYDIMYDEMSDSVYGGCY